MRNYDRPTEQTSRRMKLIKSRETRLEKRMEGVLSDAHIRYVKQPKVAGHPDFQIEGTRIVLFCDSSFWHGRRKEDLAGSSFNKNRAFWKSKIEYNRKRDRRISAGLKRMGWTVLRFWDDEILRRPDAVVDRIRRVVGETAK